MGSNGRLSNWALINHLMHNTDLTGPERFVAMVIAMHRNTITAACHPAQRTVATITHYPLTTINRLIQSLKRKGILTANKLTNHHKSPLNYVFQYDQHALEFIVPHFRNYLTLDTIGLQTKNAERNNKELFCSCNSTTNPANARCT